MYYRLTLKDGHSVSIQRNIVNEFHKLNRELVQLVSPIFKTTDGGIHINPHGIAIYIGKQPVGMVRLTKAVNCQLFFNGNHSAVITSNLILPVLDETKDLFYQQFNKKRKLDLFIHENADLRFVSYSVSRLRDILFGDDAYLVTISTTLSFNRCQTFPKCGIIFEGKRRVALCPGCCFRNRSRNANGHVVCKKCGTSYLIDMQTQCGDVFQSFFLQNFVQSNSAEKLD